MEGQVDWREKLFFYISYLCNYSFFHCSLLTIVVECNCAWHKQKSYIFVFVLLIKSLVAELVNQNGKKNINYYELNKISLFIYKVISEHQ